MIRDLKALGLGLVAVFAISATTAPIAFAQGKLTSASPVTLQGIQVGEGLNATTAFGFKEECLNGIYTGHRLGSTTESIASGSTQVTIHPPSGVCQTVASGFSFSTTVDMNGCDYVFDFGGTTGGIAGTYGVNLTIVCPQGQHIQTTLFTNSTHTNANRFCTITYTHKSTPYTGLHATNGPGGHISIAGTVTGIKADRTTGDGGDSNALLCPTQTTETAQLHVNLTVAGAGGNPISLSD
jgi:hypothetical protein